MKIKTPDSGFLDLVPDAVCISDLQGTICTVNKAFLQLTGYKEAEVIGANASILNAGLSTSEHIKSLWDEIQAGSTWEGQFTNRRKNGSIYYAKATVSPIYDEEEEKITHYISIQKDTTETERIRTVLEKQSNLLSELSNRLPGAILQIQKFSDGRTCIPYASLTLHEFFQCTEDDLAGDWSPLLNEIIPDDQPLLTSALSISEKSKDELKIEFRSKNYFGELKWYQLDAVPESIGQQGTIWHGYISDVTDKKEAEFELQNYAESIHNQNLILQKAQYEAGQANRAKGQFLANMSHEIRTPMNAVMGAASLLEDTEMDQDQKEFLEILKSGTSELMKVINDILDFSRIEDSGAGSNNKQFNLVELFEGILHILSASAVKQNIEFRTDFKDFAEQEVIGDPERLKQVLLNIGTNALKFTEKGFVAFSLHRKELVNNRAVYQFSIEDSGIGIPEDKQTHIFEPFVQVDDSNTRTYGGTGLGLAISRQLIESMSGRILLKSEPGIGSTFTVEIPLALAKPAADARQDDPAAIPAEEKKRILIVEDDETNQLIIQQYVTKLGYKHITSSNGQEALEVLHNNKFDLILMDCQMPIKDGFEATLQIRSSPNLGHSETPIVALTAMAMDGDKQKCLEAGMSDYLQKPVKLYMLAKLLEKWIPSNDS